MFGQCTTQVTHLSGTQTVGCTEVTVTSAGSAGTVTICNKGPYLIGGIGPGSYTFSFSPAIAGVRIGVYAINNNLLGEEEVSVNINGSFYPLTVPGVPDGCLDPAIISGTGTLRASCPNCVASWDDIVITENINTLTIEDVYLSGAPAGICFYLYLCCPQCPTNAGNITASPLNLCPTGIASLPDATQTYLDNNDVLQYILFSDVNDTLGSILGTSVTPNFFFNPATMQLGASYYIAAIAGDNLAGNVDLNDECLDISNAIEIIWNPFPSVTFSVANPNVCAGACTDVTATFTGTPPFTLYYTTPGNNDPTILLFPGFTGVFQVCVDADALPGSFTLQTTDLVDAYCGCE